MMLARTLAKCKTAKRVEVLTLAIVIVKTTLQQINRHVCTRNKHITHRLCLTLVLGAHRRTQRDRD